MVERKRHTILQQTQANSGEDRVMSQTQTPIEETTDKDDKHPYHVKKKILKKLPLVKRRK